jgi:hypothetical protein
MASTRNKNTPGNYALEKNASQRKHQELMFIHQSQGQARQTNLPGNGLLSGRYAGRDLAKNDNDIESFLFGIGSTNLENPLPQVSPQLNQIASLNVMEKTPVIMPRPFGIEPNQRPMYLN